MHPLTNSLLLIMVAWAATQAAEDSPVLGVCTVLRNLGRFEGKTVTIRAEYEVGPEAAGLYGSGCTGEVQLEGGKWPWAIHILMAAGADARANFLERLNSSMKRVDPRKSRVFVTMTGLLRSARNNPSYIGSNGPRPVGFRHGGVFPAEMVISTADDIRIEPRKEQEKQ
jgi:hypothetical protein